MSVIGSRLVVAHIASEDICIKLSFWAFGPVSDCNTRYHLQWIAGYRCPSFLVRMCEHCCVVVTRAIHHTNVKKKINTSVHRVILEIVVFLCWGTLRISLEGVLCNQSSELISQQKTTGWCNFRIQNAKYVKCRSTICSSNNSPRAGKCKTFAGQWEGSSGCRLWLWSSVLLKGSYGSIAAGISFSPSSISQSVRRFKSMAFLS